MRIRPSPILLGLSMEAIKLPSSYLLGWLFWAFRMGAAQPDKKVHRGSTNRGEVCNIQSGLGRQAPLRAGASAPLFEVAPARQAIGSATVLWVCDMNVGSIAVIACFRLALNASRDSDECTEPGVLRLDPKLRT